MGRNPVCYSYRATLISYRSCLKPLDTFRRLANKAIAHTEADRRRLGKLTYQRLDDAIDLLAETYKTYCKLITGACLDPLVQLSYYDVTEYFRRIWP
jgi:hypothetical protein